MAVRKRRPIWIPVVTAIMHRGDKVLLGQRPDGGSMAGVWEFPGGKIENGESPEQALKRELQEELGIEAEIGSLKFAATHSYGDTGIVLLFYDVRYWKGEIKSVHHTDVKWVKTSEIVKEELPEANQKVLGQILSSLE